MEASDTYIKQAIIYNCEQQQKINLNIITQLLKKLLTSKTSLCDIEQHSKSTKKKYTTLERTK